MDKDEIRFPDWERLLFGNAPVEFLLEVLVRSVLIYTMLLLVIKLLGKRMSGRLTIMEWAVMLTMGALISLPMQAPERGLLHGFVLLAVVFLLERLQMIWSFHNSKVESTLLGKMVLIVKDGVLQKKQMDAIRLSREQLCSFLRAAKIYQLGMVKRVYQEATGDFSIYKADHPKPGLSILPEGDRDVQERLQPSTDRLFACTDCGHTVAAPRQEHVKHCVNCGNDRWVQAVQ